MASVAPKLNVSAPYTFPSYSSEFLKATDMGSSFSIIMGENKQLELKVKPSYTTKWNNLYMAI